MNKLILIFILCFGYALNSTAQKGLPYKPVEIRLQVPVDLPDLEQDSTARKGDFLIYDVTGQIINDTEAFEIQPIASTDRSTPWMVLGELLQAYGTGSLENITALYTKSSVNQINSVLSNADAKNNFFASVKDIKNMHPYFAMDYDNGVIALVETSPGNVERFRFEKEGHKYRLAAYQEKNSPQINNVMVYYSYRPLPAIKPELLQAPDSLKSDESPFISFKLQKSGDWISVFVPIAGYSVELQEKDGGLNDYDHAGGIVKMILYGSSFPAGDLELEAVETNYPPNMISNAMISTGLKFKVKINE